MLATGHCSPGPIACPWTINSCWLSFELKGAVEEIPAAVTPGSTRTRSTSGSTSRRTCAISWNLVNGTAMRPTTAFRGSKPGFTSMRRAKLLSSSPAPTSSTTESASCDTTNASFKRRLEAAPVARALSLRLAARSTLAPRRAGARPNRTPASTPKKSANPRTTGSSRIPSMTETRSAARRLKYCTAGIAPSTPRPAPESERTRLSTRSWRTTRPGLAPSAVRTAISRCRAPARASWRLARLAQAKSSTKQSHAGRRSSPRTDAQTPHIEGRCEALSVIPTGSSVQRLLSHGAV